MGVGVDFEEPLLRIVFYFVELVVPNLPYLCIIYTGIHDSSGWASVTISIWNAGKGTGMRIRERMAYYCLEGQGFRGRQSRAHCFKPLIGVRSGYYKADLLVKHPTHARDLLYIGEPTPGRG